MVEFLADGLQGAVKLEVGGRLVDRDSLRPDLVEGLDSGPE